MGGARMTRIRAYLIVAALLLAWVAIPDGPAASSEPSTPAIPACEEDAVLIGVGDFEQGRWSAYTCGPAVDDYEEG